MNLLVLDYDNTYELHYPNHDCLNIFKMNKVAMGKFMEKGNYNFTDVFFSNFFYKIKNS